MLGSAIGARGTSAPLLLLGFRRDGADSPSHEALIPGRALADVPDDVLEDALARAVERPAEIRRKPFFEDADGARRT